MIVVPSGTEERCIFKYHITDPTGSTFRWPVGTKVLRAGFQGDLDEPRIVLWALTNPYAALNVKRTFIAVNTGPKLPPGEYEYIDTVIVPNGIVWHILEVLSHGKD
jgi:hypothetical protein